MKSREIRKTFLDFFQSKKHTVVSSASLVPENDPTLLFTNAGMNQFKDIFLGTGKRDYVRAADTQKCMRVSGKHNDLEDVGKDTYHHTFFEMLGNWSFGDYYKKEAITWAWELLTDIWKLPKDKLYATVYHTDDEALKLWGEITDINKEHILKFGDKDNFWEMGATGPCGPCSEIHIDRGEGTCDKQHIEGHKCAVNSGCARYIELWNLVFIQYNRKEDTTLEPLPSKHVDTGMGFERIASVIQGKKSNYDTDIFTPIINRIEELCGRKYQEETGMPMRVIADHIRSLSFSMADGVMPSNEGRGYVIRKILRRAIRYGKYLGFDAPFLHKLVDVLKDTMGEAFPEIVTRAEMVKSLILSEEESFFKTLYRGLDKLNEIVTQAKRQKTGKISGDDAFVLYDSLGLPIDFIQHTAEDEDLVLDRKRFDELMEAQKERARANWKNDAFDFGVIKGNVKPSIYTGDEEISTESVLSLIAKGGSLTDTASAGDDVVIVTEKTPFYAEKGGQVGDTGTILKGEAKISVRQTKVYEDAVVHFGVVENGSFKKGDKVTMAVDADKKSATARNHTATHLIHKALRHVVGDHAAQAGSLVGPERLRFDFTHAKALTPQEIERIEDEVNQVVLKNLPVQKTKMGRDEAVKSGAVAIFEEKYGDVVRVVEVPGYSKELCGGTHVNATGDIGLIRIVQETSISAGTRRLEALTGLNSLTDYRKYSLQVKDLAVLLSVDESRVVERIKELQESLKQKDKELSEQKNKLARGTMQDMIKKAAQVNGHTIVLEQVDLESDAMLAALDEFKVKSQSGVVFLIAAQAEGKVGIVAGVTKDLVQKIKAGDIARETAKIVGGGGGGRPDMAQAGGKDASKIGEALAKAKEMIEAALK